MDIAQRTIWQQACGDTNRNYSETCLKWDVILNGPGYAGQYPECDQILKAHGWKSKKRTDIRRFAKEMRDGDIVVLRLGTNTILGVGIIVGEYSWNDFFCDIDGWDLHHVRRVRWLWNGLSTPKNFPIYALKQGDTTQILNSQPVKDWLTTLQIPDNSYIRELKDIPLTGRKIVESEIAEYLFEKGVSSNFITNLMNEFGELQRIAKWYEHKSAPSESETITYLVVPILRSLGWTPQKMAIEWRKVDIALFDQLPREDQNLSVVVEVKKKGSSCLTAVSQAERYAHGKINCDRLIVTDGLRYGIFLKGDSKYVLYAYFNLLDFRESYPVYECRGIKEALRVISSDWKR